MPENRIVLITSEYDEAVKISAYLQAAEYDVVIKSKDCSIANELAEQSYNLILTDLELVTDALISAANSACVPVMCLMEAAIAESSVNEVYSRGCVDYVTIPVDRYILIARVKNQIDIVNDEVRMHKAKDYLYDFTVSVSHDIKNQFTVSERLSDWLLDNGNGHINEDSRIILEHLSSFCNKTRYLLEAIEDKTVNESRHRGGFVRCTAYCNIGQ